MLSGLLLIASLALLIWLVVRRRPWLARIGRAIADEFTRSAQWYMGVPPPSKPAVSRAKADVEIPDTLASRAEAVFTAHLLDGTLTRDDYQRAMAELAADDERQHPMSVPPWR